MLMPYNEILLQLLKITYLMSLNNLTKYFCYIVKF